MRSGEGAGGGPRRQVVAVGRGGNTEGACPAETTAAPRGPMASCVAAAAGTFEAATLAAVIVYCTAAFMPIYRTATSATPAIRAMGMVRSGALISPLTMFRSFHPSYAHKAATSASMNPVMPPLAPAKWVEKLLQLPVAAVNPTMAIPAIMTTFRMVDAS